MLWQDQSVAIVGERLLVPVHYEGGCTDHVFELRSDVGSDSATVWLHHDAGGDLCEALVTETVDVGSPKEAQTTTRTTLYAPNPFGGGVGLVGLR